MLCKITSLQLLAQKFLYSYKMIFTIYITQMDLLPTFMHEEENINSSEVWTIDRSSAILKKK